MHCRYSRGWFYHRELQLWLMRIGEPLVKTQTYERGSYHYFDPSTWQTIRKVKTFILALLFLLLVFYMLDIHFCSHVGQLCSYLRGIGEETSSPSALDVIVINFQVIFSSISIYQVCGAIASFNCDISSDVVVGMPCSSSSVLLVGFCIFNDSVIVFSEAMHGKIYQTA